MGRHLSAVKLDTFTLAVYAIAAILGWIVGAILVLVMFG